jgi:hypothetical protein
MTGTTGKKCNCRAEGHFPGLARRFGSSETMWALKMIREQRRKGDVLSSADATGESERDDLSAAVPRCHGRID